MPEVRLSAAIAPPAAAPPTTTGTQAVICEISAADKISLSAVCLFMFNFMDFNFIDYSLILLSITPRLIFKTFLKLYFRE
jgi:hypothetical protein